MSDQSPNQDPPASDEDPRKARQGDQLPEEQPVKEGDDDAQDGIAGDD